LVFAGPAFIVTTTVGSETTKNADYMQFINIQINADF